MLLERLSSSLRRKLRMASGLILFAYIGAHLINHALGLISLDTAEAGMSIAVEVWYSTPGTIVLYGAFATHFMMALFAVYERRTFRLPPLELLRIVLGFTMPILLIGHAASTRLAYEMFGLSSDYTRIVSNLWATGSQGWQLGLMAPGWLHGCLGCISPSAGAGGIGNSASCCFPRPCCCRCWRRWVSSPWARSLPQSGRGGRGPAIPQSGQRRAAARHRAVEGQAPQLVFLDHRVRLHRPRDPQSGGAAEKAPRVVVVSRADRPGAPGLVGAGGKPELPLGARGDVRRAGALLDLPGAGDGGRGVLSAAGRRRAGNPGAHRRAIRRAARLPVAANRRHLGGAAGSHRAADLPHRRRSAAASATSSWCFAISAIAPSLPAITCRTTCSTC